MRMGSKARGGTFGIAHAKRTIPACSRLPFQAPTVLSKPNPLAHCPGPHKRATWCTGTHELLALCMLSELEQECISC